jgi:hypothetical protein
MDCQTFDASLLDALYDELDAPSSRAMAAHAAGCTACATRADGLKRTREIIGHHRVELPFPDGLEARILAAAGTAMPRRAPARGVVAFLSRPYFAVAATLIVVLGGAAFLVQTTARSTSAPPAPSSSAADLAPATSEPAPVELAAPPAAAAVAAPPMPAPKDEEPITRAAVAAKSAADAGYASAASAVRAARPAGPRAVPAATTRAAPMIDDARK